MTETAIEIAGEMLHGQNSVCATAMNGQFRNLTALHSGSRRKVVCCKANAFIELPIKDVLIMIKITQVQINPPCPLDIRYPVGKSSFLTLLLGAK